MLDENTISITYSQSPRPCRKGQCSLCKAGKEHLPYWFATAVIGDIEHHLYLGNEFRQVSLQEFLELKPTHTRKEAARSNKKNGQKLLIGISISEAKSTYLVSLKEDISTKPGWSATRQEIEKNSRKNENIKLRQRPATTTVLPTSKEFQQDLRRFKNVRFKDLKDHYRQLIKKYHPDQFGEDNLQVEEWMKMINMVHETHLHKMQRFAR
ncbi:MAG: J domain-containing protein [SAR324 cluster bacterium]|nr:J domain-containing protein [SAR324 cluster bacterium]